MSLRRDNQVVTIAELMKQRGEVGLTRSEAANHLGLKLTPYVIDMLKQLVHEGYAVVVSDPTGRREHHRYFFQE